MNCKEEKEYRLQQEHKYERQLSKDLGFALNEFNAVDVIEKIKQLHKQLKTYGWDFEPNELCEILWEIG